MRLLFPLCYVFYYWPYPCPNSDGHAISHPPFSPNAFRPDQRPQEQGASCLRLSLPALHCLPPCCTFLLRVPSSGSLGLRPSARGRCRGLACGVPVGCLCAPRTPRNWTRARTPRCVHARRRGRASQAVCSPVPPIWLHGYSQQPGDQPRSTKRDAPHSPLHPEDRRIRSSRDLVVPRCSIQAIRFLAHLQPSSAMWLPRPLRFALTQPYLCTDPDQTETRRYIWSGPRPGGLALRLRGSWETEVRG